MRVSTINEFFFENLKENLTLLKMYDRLCEMSTQKQGHESLLNKLVSTTLRRCKTSRRTAETSELHQQRNTRAHSVMNINLNSGDKIKSA